MADNVDDSFDNVLADIEIPSMEKKLKLTGNSVINEALSSSQYNKATTNQPALDPKKNSTSKTNCILVNSKQRGNPILKSIINVPWEYDDIIPDYVVGEKACILYLSLKYHNLNPDYINGRLKKLGKMFELRIMLVQIDTKDPHNALKHLTRVCFLADLTLMLAWNAEEAGKIIETYKMFENKQPTLIMERAEQYPHQKLVSALTNIKPVNKTDAMTLLQTYGNLANLINSTADRLSQCSGLGPRKAKKLHQTFNENFLKN